MRGTVRKITLPRRLVADLMHASLRVPFVSLARPLQIRALQEARAKIKEDLFRFRTCCADPRASK